MKIEAVEFIRSAHGENDFLRDGLPEIAFAGRSNVGKSSLVNKLLGRKGLARTSSTPGRTQAVIYFKINRRLYFVDLPGYGYAKASKRDRAEWGRLVDTYFRQSEQPPLVVLLVDSKVGATPLDIQAKEYFLDMGVPLIVVATKADKLRRSRRTAGLAAIRRRLEMGDENRLIPVSVNSGEGIGPLWGAIESYLETGARSHRQGEETDG